MVFIRPLCLSPSRGLLSLSLSLDLTLSLTYTHTDTHTIFARHLSPSAPSPPLATHRLFPLAHYLWSRICILMANPFFADPLLGHPRCRPATAPSPLTLYVPTLTHTQRLADRCACVCVNRFYDQCKRKIENKFPRIDGCCLGAARAMNGGGVSRQWQCCFFLSVFFCIFLAVVIVVLGGCA